MPRKTSDQRSKVSKPVTLLVYGLDDKNEPRAATFVSSDPGELAKGRGPGPQGLQGNVKGAQRHCVGIA